LVGYGRAADTAGTDPMGLAMVGVRPAPIVRPGGGMICILLVSFFTLG
jgi:hypothetical protein